jgi:hypothetical protein
MKRSRRKSGKSKKRTYRGRAIRSNRMKRSRGRSNRRKTRRNRKGSRMMGGMQRLRQVAQTALGVTASNQAALVALSKRDELESAGLGSGSAHRKRIEAMSDEDLADWIGGIVPVNPQTVEDAIQGERSKMMDFLIEHGNDVRNVILIQNHVRRILDDEVVYEPTLAELGVVTEAFRVFDKKSTGFIAPSELRRVMTKVGPRLTNEEVDIMIRGVETELDGDNNHQIIYDTMIAWITTGLAAELRKEVTVSSPEQFLRQRLGGHRVRRR